MRFKEWLLFFLVGGGGCFFYSKVTDSFQSNINRKSVAAQMSLKLSSSVNLKSIYRFFNEI